MARYIDADEARMAIAECFLDMNDSFVESATECNAMIDLAIDKIKELPTADVQPVKRGEWVKHDIGPVLAYYKCSVCGEPVTAFIGTPQENAMNFCPNCGARMVEE